MKLRNKKTGEIWKTAAISSYPCGAGYRLLVAKNSFTTVGKHYNSLAELNEEWEDCEPVFDEKIRRGIRGWWDMQGNPFKYASVLLRDNKKTL